MPKLEIKWTTSGDPDQDQALADQIADFVFPLLDGHDPAMEGELGFAWLWRSPADREKLGRRQTPRID